jgi:4-alpha-glucanotransferase
MSDAEVIALAEAAGVMPRWKDYRGATHDVSPASLRRVLAALGFPAASEAEIRNSRNRLEQEQSDTLPPLVIADAGRPIRLGIRAGSFRVLLEDGTPLEGRAEERNGGSVLPPIEIPGYHALEIATAQTTIAVAPERCFSLTDAGAYRPWGIAAQLYSLRREHDGGVGDFTALREFARSAASHGAAAIAISPVHAQFSADPGRFSPYAPSSRLALNVLHIDPDELAAPPPEALRERPEQLPLIDWPAAARARLRRLRAIWAEFASFPDALRREFAEFRVHRPDVESHARFEALHARFFGADAGQWSWRNWPEPYRDPHNAAVEQFARAHASDVAFHAFLQFLAERQLQAAQREARSAGMHVGLIADLAVGSDAGGSQSWSRQEDMLAGLTIGAPPDLYNAHGQSWGVAPFSPAGLRRTGYAGFIAMLRAALRNAGGVRIDHAMGLSRLWMIPDGAQATEGAYVRFPLDDMLRLLALETQRHRGIVLGEDLGTVPDGFRDKLEGRGVLGMRVLWFERDDTSFHPPARWSRCAAAMTSTHDLPTVAGWWQGRDLEWRKKLNMLGDENAVRSEYENRSRDRERLWRAFRDSGAASGDMPPAEQPAPAVDAAVRHIGRAACEMVLLQVEDALGEPEQPNLPGTTTEHPNWRRRTTHTAEALLGEPEVAARLSALAAIRAQ